MTTLPLIQQPRTRASYLRFPASLEPSPSRYSLEQQTYRAVHNKKYLYIDFQTEDNVLELEKSNQPVKVQDQSQRIGGSSIGGLEALSKISPQAYRMHKFLSEQKLYLQRKTKWQTLLKRKDEDTQINFSKIREKINPEKLEDYLENKHNEDNWKRIQDREQKLFLEIDNQSKEKVLTTNQNRVNASRRLKASSDFRGKAKLKALGKLNSLLEKF